MMSHDEIFYCDECAGQKREFKGTPKEILAHCKEIHWGHIGIGIEDSLPLKDPYGKPDKN